MRYINLRLMQIRPINSNWSDCSAFDLTTCGRPFYGVYLVYIWLRIWTTSFNFIAQLSDVSCRGKYTRDWSIHKYLYSALLAVESSLENLQRGVYRVTSMHQQGNVPPCNCVARVLMKSRACTSSIWGTSSVKSGRSACQTMTETYWNSLMFVPSLYIGSSASHNNDSVWCIHVELCN